MYYKGEGISKNYSKAINLFLDASFMGHPASQINVGNMFYFEKVLEKIILKLICGGVWPKRRGLMQHSQI